MKKSIKVAALTLLAAGMLVGCSKEAPAKSKWSKAEEEGIREVLYGESLPFVSGVKNLQVEASTKFGEVSISGGKATPKVLEKYAAKFTSEEGWYSLDEEEENDAAAAFKAEEAPVLSYTFEKEVETLEGTRFITVQFGSVDEDLKFVLDGDFMLYANDPYMYDFPSDYLSAAIAYNFYSTVEVPAVDARRYVWDDDNYVVYCDIPNGTTVEADYKAALEKEGWVVWFDDSYELWTANAPDKAFSIYYYYEEGTMLIGLYTVENEPSEVFPEQYFADFYVSNGVHALVDLPDYTIASEEGYFISDFSWMSYGYFIVYAMESTRDEMMSFVGALEADGWTCEPDEYEDYDCTKAYGYSLAYLKVMDYTDPDLYDELYVEIDATVYTNYEQASSFPIPSTYFTSAGYVGAQIAEYDSLTFAGLISALETVLGVQYESDYSMFYIETVEGESLVDATEKLVANFPEYFTVNTEPEEREDSYGDPMGYADYYVGTLFGVEVNVFEYEPYAACVFVYEFGAKFEYTYGVSMDEDYNILNACEVDIYDSSAEEMLAYKTAMEALGWTFELDEDSGFYVGSLAEVAGVSCLIADLIEDYGCIAIQFSYVANAFTAYSSLTAAFGEGMPMGDTVIMFYVEAYGSLEGVLNLVSSFVPVYTLGYSTVMPLEEGSEELFGLGQYYALDGSFGIEIQVFDNSENAGEGAYAAAIYFVLL